MNTIICMLPGVCISNFQAGYAPHIIAHGDFVNLSLLEITQFRELSEIPATFWQSRWAPGTSWSWTRGRGAGAHILALREKLEGPAQGRRCKLRVSHVSVGLARSKADGRALILWPAAGCHSRHREEAGVWKNTRSGVKQPAACLLVPEADTSTARKTMRSFHNCPSSLQQPPRPELGAHQLLWTES